MADVPAAAALVYFYMSCIVYCIVSCIVVVLYVFKQINLCSTKRLQRFKLVIVSKSAVVGCCLTIYTEYEQ